MGKMVTTRRRQRCEEAEGSRLRLRLLFLHLHLIDPQLLLLPQDPLQESIPVASFKRGSGNPQEPIPYRLGKSSDLYSDATALIIFHVYLSLFYTRSIHKPDPDYYIQILYCMYNSCPRGSLPSRLIFQLNARRSTFSRLSQNPDR